MHGRSNTAGKQLRPAVIDVATSSLQDAKQRLFHLRKLLKDVWTRFCVGYLNELHQVNLYRRVKNSDNTREISVDDIVLIKDDEPMPRAQWRMGKIVKLVKGRDGPTSIHRPVQQRIPFENQESPPVMDSE